MTTRDQVCLPCNMTVRDRPGKTKPEADPGWAETGRFKTPPPRKCLGSGKGNKIRRSLRCLNAIAHKAESRPAMFALFAKAERPPLNSSGHIQQGLAPPFERSSGNPALSAPAVPFQPATARSDPLGKRKGRKAYGEGFPL